MAKYRIYGQWAGNPKGIIENTDNCIVSVYRNNDYYDSQCKRKRGYGKGGLYCKQHSKIYEHR